MIQQQQTHRTLDDDPDRLLDELSAAVNGDGAASLIERLRVAIAARSQQHRQESDASAKYLSFLSHDLRGCLNGIVLMLELLRRELDGKPEFVESVNDIALMRKSILDAVNSMERHLMLSRMRRGKVKPERQRVSVNQLFEEAMREAESSARAGGRAVKVSAAAPAGLEVEADPQLVRLTLHGLVTNAVRYPIRGGVKLSARVEGKDVVLTVSDEGPGMPPEKLEPLLDASKRTAKDRGIGVPLAHEATRLMGGRIEIASDPTGGTDARVILPRPP